MQAGPSRPRRRPAPPGLPARWNSASTLASFALSSPASTIANRQTGSDLRQYHRTPASLSMSNCQTAFNIDGVDASSRRHRSVPRWWRNQPPEEEASMEQVNIIGIDLAKRSFQLHGARADGSVAFRRKVSRERLLYILGAQQRCVVAMEACASAHYWGREILKLGHEVRFVPPIYVKPFVNRQSYQGTSLRRYVTQNERLFVPDPMPTGMFLPPEPEQPPQNRAHRPISPTAHPCRPDGREQHRAGSAGSLSWH